MKLPRISPWQRHTAEAEEQIIESLRGQSFRSLSQKEGIFVEPASAASVAGLIKYSKTGYFEGGSRIVCIVTGHGLKDPDRAIASIEKPAVLENDIKAILKEIGH